LLTALADLFLSETSSIGFPNPKSWQSTISECGLVPFYARQPISRGEFG
jgi:hypothetical protein